MKNLLLLLLAASFSYAVSIQTLVRYYKEKNYYDVCLQGGKIFRKLQNDENLLTMYAFSCLYVDKIDRLYLPAMILGKSKESRHNRSYFSLIIAQKNILVSALVDGEHYEGLNVPNTDYVLSRVFNLFFQKKYKRVDNRYIMQDERGKYILYTKPQNGRTWLIIEEERNNKRFLHKYR